MRWAKFELECLLLFIFIYTNSKFVIICENVVFECRYIKLIRKGNRLDIQHYIHHFAFLSKNKNNNNNKKKKQTNKQTKTKNKNKNKNKNKTKQKQKNPALNWIAILDKGRE